MLSMYWTPMKGLLHLIGLSVPVLTELEIAYTKFMCDISDSTVSLLRLINPNKQIHIDHYVLTLQSTSTGVDIFFSLIFSYFCFFVPAYATYKSVCPSITHHQVYQLYLNTYRHQ